MCVLYSDTEIFIFFPFKRSVLESVARNSRHPKSLYLRPDQPPDLSPTFRFLSFRIWESTKFARSRSLSSSTCQERPQSYSTWDVGSATWTARVVLSSRRDDDLPLLDPLRNTPKGRCGFYILIELQPSLSAQSVSSKVLLFIFGELRWKW